MKKYGFTYWACLSLVIGAMLSTIWCEKYRSIEAEIAKSIQDKQDSLEWDSIMRWYREHEDDDEIIP